MSANDLVLTNALFPNGDRGSIAIRKGAFYSFGDVDPGAESIDLAGGLVLPGFVEGHIHLDKCFIGDEWHPHRPARSIRERIRIEREELAKAKPVDVRARALVEQCVTRGTSVIRTHIDVDPEIGLAHIDAILRVREEYRHAVEIEIVAFPQHGVLVNPGTLALMEEAIGRGVDLVGGLDPATFDGDVTGQLDAVYALAERTGKPIDIHLHDGGEIGAMELIEIAERARAEGMQGRVAVSHAYALGAIPDALFEQAAEALADGGVSIMTNAPGDHAFPPVLRLRAAGVNVFAGNDNVRDVWWPYGDADLLERAMMIGYRSAFDTDDDLAVAFDLITAAGAKAIGLTSYGLVPGAPANLVVVAARHIPEAVVARPQRALVLHRGKVVARDGQFVA